MSILVRGMEVPGLESSSTEVVIVNEGGAGISLRGEGVGEEPEAVVLCREGVDIASVLLLLVDMLGLSVVPEGVAEVPVVPVVEPGLIMRCTTAPSAISYSLSSFESVRAFPFKRRRCESGGGAEGDAFEMRDFSVVIGSRREMVMGRVSDGFRDLTVMVMFWSGYQPGFRVKKNAMKGRVGRARS